MTKADILRFKPLIDRTRWRLTSDMTTPARDIIEECLEAMLIWPFHDTAAIWSEINAECPFDDETIAMWEPQERKETTK